MIAMAYRCLADFLEDLGHAGELARVETEVDSRLELAEITRRIADADGPALLFGKVQGHEIPIVSHLLGSQQRICRALGIGQLSVLSERIERLVDPATPEGWFEKLKTAPHVAALSQVPPRSVRSGACQQVVRLGDDVDLTALPLPLVSEVEQSPTLTAAVLATVDPDTHRAVSGRYDLKRIDSGRVALGWAAHDEPARLLGEYRRHGEKMPVAVVFGGDPAVLLAAMAALGPQADALTLAGLLREKPLDLVACRSVDLSVAADAEIVIEGYVDPVEPLVETAGWPTPSGYVASPRLVPVMHATAVTHRANPVLPVMIPGKEGGVIARSLARALLPLWRQTVPELVDFDLPMLGAARHLAVISIRKRYAGQAQRVAQAMLSLWRFWAVKWLIVVDESVAVDDLAQVMAAVSTQTAVDRDLMNYPGPADPWDIAAEPCQLGQRLVIDATAKLPGERRQSAWPQRLEAGQSVRDQVRQRWGEYGLGLLDETNNP